MTLSVCRRRPDTVKHILARMLDEESELAEVMRQVDITGTENVEEDYDNWEPEPIDAGKIATWTSFPLEFQTEAPSVGTRQERAADIITRLISIFDTKDVFVHEYHKILVGRLLKKLDYETDKEVMNDYVL